MNLARAMFGVSLYIQQVAWNMLMQTQSKHQQVLGSCWNIFSIMDTFSE
jgi:hypothetical protein